MYIHPSIRYRAFQRKLTSPAIHKQRHRNEVHPPRLSIPCVQKKTHQPRNPQWRRKQIRADDELVAQESTRPPLADVAHMDVLQKIDRNKSMPNLPQEIRQKDQQRHPNSTPEPPTQKISSRMSQQHATQNPSNKETNRVFGLQPNPDRHPNGNPPPRIL